jgi:hypothetical protein
MFITNSFTNRSMNCSASHKVSRAAHRRIYSFFAALRAPAFIHIYTNKHTFPLPQLVQAVTQGQKIAFRYKDDPSGAAPSLISGKD